MKIEQLISLCLGIAVVFFVLGFALGYRTAEKFYRKIADIWRNAYHEIVKKDDLKETIRKAFEVE